MSYQSIRPSAQLRRNIQSNATPSNFVIIGNTSLAVIYATKIYETFKNDAVQPQIYLITTGNDQTTDVMVESLDYIQMNNQTIYKSLEPNK